MERMNELNSSELLNIFLADDDKDDCAFFKEALDELQISSRLTTVHNGEQLMKLLLDKTYPLPDVLFLDLNMPRKSGFQCLEEIKQDVKLKALAVIIYSTSYDENIADALCKNGARHFICKPNDFLLLRNVIHQALSLFVKERYTNPIRANFVLGNLK